MKPPPRRVAQSCPSWLPQSQAWLYAQISALPADRVESVIVTQRVRDLEQFPMTEVLSARAMPARMEAVRALRKPAIRYHMWSTARLFDVSRAELVHSHFGHQGWKDHRAVRARGLPHVVTFYGFDLTQLPRDPAWARRFDRLFSSADRFLCEGPHMASTLVGLGCPEHKVRVHRLGVALARIPFVPRVWRPGEPLRVLLASRFTEKKGVTYGLRALAALTADVDVQISLVGDAIGTKESQFEKQRILATVEELGLGSRVRFYGMQSHERLMEIAYDHHIFLAPSVTSGTGNAEGGAPVIVTETLASGMPVVATRHCDIPDVVGPIYRARLSAERDVDGLERQLRLLVDSPSEWESQLQTAREHVSEHFDSETQAARLAAIYEALV